ncbi:phosphotransferase [Candidatus Parcubacteria bacterium]|nr:phosphotransferase [Patescibacteria group bacterium]MBU4309858.1 phosphotransferase [Patescibacteria group bacterium]MBU4431731.1 phosphotransferase [Patescibacteria group bacterium]MBU4578197.1 phosphotransferase [Patescibacteria group bacterium]MCG2696733.1 phosphotransferase [Candidatus Parcubacteria bacterium]
MNRINQLLDDEYVITYLKKRILPSYPDFVDIKKVVIKPWKKLIWETTYHVVIEFVTTFVDKKGKRRELPIFCTAHSTEPRKNVYDNLKFLWSHGFGDGYLSIPHPLYYSDYFRATFYRGVKGSNLYYFIRESNFPIIEDMVPKTAKWFSRLHKLKVSDEQRFNEDNSRIKTVYPGVEHTLERIQNDFPEYYDFYVKAYAIFVKNEEEFLSSTSKRWLVHGDAHPENVIRMGKRKIGVIDFTDLSFTDFARDLGTFSQQLEYMCSRKIADESYQKKIKNLFLDSYFKSSRVKLTEDLQKRIDNYYNWTAIRTATFLLLKYDPNPERAQILIDRVKQNLNI